MNPPTPMSPLAITAHTLVTALGHGLADHAQALRDGRSGLKPQVFETAPLDTWLGVAPDLDDAALGSAFSRGQSGADCRNEPMVRRPRALELIAGTSVDPLFGPVVLFGAGGTSVEILSLIHI